MNIFFNAIISVVLGFIIGSIVAWLNCFGEPSDSLCSLRFIIFSQILTLVFFIIFWIYSFFFRTPDTSENRREGFKKLFIGMGLTLLLIAVFFMIMLAPGFLSYFFIR